MVGSWEQVCTWPFEVTISAYIASPEGQSVYLLVADKAKTLVTLVVEGIQSPFILGEAVSLFNRVVR